MFAPLSKYFYPTIKCFLVAALQKNEKIYRLLLTTMQPKKYFLKFSFICELPHEHFDWQVYRLLLKSEWEKSHPRSFDPFPLMINSITFVVRFMFCFSNDCNTIKPFDIIEYSYQIQPSFYDFTFELCIFTWLLAKYVGKLSKLWR